jgi:hypothetical protein
LPEKLRGPLQFGPLKNTTLAKQLSPDLGMAKYNASMMKVSPSETGKHSLIASNKGLNSLSFTFEES